MPVAAFAVMLLAPQRSTALESKHNALVLKQLISEFLLKNKINIKNVRYRKRFYAPQGLICVYFNIQAHKKQVTNVTALMTFVTIFCKLAQQFLSIAIYSEISYANLL
jgi:hypothetical protein